MKKILVMLMVVSILLSGISVSFGESDPVEYAESEDELLQAEILLNNVIAESKDKENKEIDSVDESKIADKNAKSEFKKKKAEKKQYLKNLKSYKDFNTFGTIEDVEKALTEKGYPINNEFATLCKEIDNYRCENSSEDIKNVVKHFNSKAGLKEKSKKKRLISFSSGTAAYALSYSDWTRLTTSEKLLIASDPKAALMTNSLSKVAYKWTQEKFGYNGLGDKSDGFRHGVWNALMTRDISRSWASAYATAHEDIPQAELQKKDSDGYYKYQHKSMDLHNNQVGRDQIAWYEFFFNCGDSTVKSRISAKLTNKSADIIWLHN